MTTVVQTKSWQYQQEGALKRLDLVCFRGGEGGKEGIVFAGRMEEMNITRKEDVKKYSEV